MAINTYEKYNYFMDFYEEIIKREKYFCLVEDGEVMQESLYALYKKKHRKKFKKFKSYKEDIEKKKPLKIEKKLDKLNKFIFKTFDKYGLGNNPMTIEGSLVESNVFQVYFEQEHNLEINAEFEINEENKATCVMLAEDMRYGEKLERVIYSLSLELLQVDKVKNLNMLPLGIYESKGQGFVIFNRYFKKYIGFTSEEELVLFFENNIGDLEGVEPVVSLQEMKEKGYITNLNKARMMIEKLNDDLRNTNLAKTKRMVPLQTVPLHERQQIEDYMKELKYFVGSYLVDNEEDLIRVQNEFIDEDGLKNVQRYCTDMLLKYTKIKPRRNSANNDSVLAFYTQIFELPNTNKPIEEKALETESVDVEK